jgi:CubicO group peptidase (beta-lactamase class C family)
LTREWVSDVLSRADELVVEAMNDDGVPGAGVGIVSSSETVYAKGFGLADVAQERPVTPKTAFRIGSIAKTMTAVGLMQLWEQGLFDLDDPVNRYLRAYRVKHPDPSAPPVTFRHMLTHTSGLGEVRGVTDLFRPVIGLGAKPDRPVPTPATYYPGGLRPSVRPGTRWAYSNHAFNTLGQLVEDISGEPFARYMRTRVFDPLGMASTDYLLSERVRGELAQGYNFSRNGLKPAGYLEIIVRGAGSVFSSVEDMCRYVAALLGGGANEHGTVLREETLSLMMEPHYRLDRRLPAMGLAFLLDDCDGFEIVGHDGGWPGFLSSMQLNLETGVGVVVFVNATSKAAHESARKLMRCALRLPDPPATRRGVLGSPHLWPELRGFYGTEGPLNINARVWLAYAGEIEVRVKDRNLLMRTLAGPLRKGVRLSPADANDPLVFEAAIEGQTHRVVFGRNPENGRVEHLLLGFDRLRKRPGTRSLRFKTAGAGMAAGSILVAAAWRGVMRPTRAPEIPTSDEGA